MQKPPPDITQHSQETDIHAPGGIWPAIPASERPQTHALDRTATGIGSVYSILDENPDYSTQYP
jgi:hypothetical protein